MEPCRIDCLSMVLANGKAVKATDDEHEERDGGAAYQDQRIRSELAGDGLAKKITNEHGMNAKEQLVKVPDYVQEPEQQSYVKVHTHGQLKEEVRLSALAKDEETKATDETKEGRAGGDRHRREGRSRGV